LDIKQWHIGSRFRIINQTEDLHEWVLDLSFANMHYLDLYLPIADGEGYEVRQTGVLRPFESRDIPFHHLAFKLEIVPGGEQIVYLRFQNEATMTLPLTLRPERTFSGYMLLDQMVFGIFYGALLVILFYNLFLFILIRQRSYLNIVLFIFNLTIFWFIYDGFVFQYIQFESLDWAPPALLIFLGLSLFFMVRFIDSLLDLAARNPAAASNWEYSCESIPANRIGHPVSQLLFAFNNPGGPHFRRIYRHS
jgi:two-component system, sensor histidine kinase LadS